MKIKSLTAVAVVFAGCATLGGQSEFSGTSVGSIPDTIDCISGEVVEEGFIVTSRDDSGLLRAEMGASWISASVLPAEAGLSASNHLIRIATSGDAAAEDAASDAISGCST